MDLRMIKSESILNEFFFKVQQSVRRHKIFLLLHLSVACISDILNSGHSGYGWRLGFDRSTTWVYV